MATKKPDQGAPLEIQMVETRTTVLHLLGTSPLLLHALSAKAKQQLLFPEKAKTRASKAITLKHDPVAEYRDGVLIDDRDDAPTYLLQAATAFKGALRSAAIDTPGASKAQIGRLCYVPGDYVPIFGVPKLHMATVRMADISRTPDIRTRCVLPEWAAVVSITYTVPLLSAQVVASLMAAAGIYIGTGDWRPEKGSGAYGRFRLVDHDDKDFLRIVKQGGRAAQLDAMENPEPFDAETAKLWAWFQDEAINRGMAVTV